MKTKKQDWSERVSLQVERRQRALKGAQQCYYAKRAEGMDHPTALAATVIAVIEFMKDK